MLCVLPCCSAHMAQPRQSTKSSGVEGPVAKGVVVTVGRGYHIERSEICDLEALEVGSIPPVRGSQVQGPTGKRRKRA